MQERGKDGRVGGRSRKGSRRREKARNKKKKGRRKGRRREVRVRGGNKKGAPHIPTQIGNISFRQSQVRRT